MANISDVPVYDGAATPVLHTLVADHVEYVGQSVKAFWKEKLAGVPEYAQVSLILAKDLLKSGTIRVSHMVEVPIMEAVAGQNSSGYTAAPKVAYSEKREVVQWVHPRSLQQGRQDAKMMSSNFDRNLVTTQTPVTSGWCYDAFVRLVMPT